MAPWKGDENRAAEVRDEWRLLADKAERWLAAAFAERPEGARSLVEERLAGLY